MLYFDNAATGGRKPDEVLDAFSASVKVCTNPGRSGHKLSLSCAGVVLDCRNALSDFFDGYGYERVAFTKNCTEALNIAVFGLLNEGDHVVTTCMEHNSVLRPLEYLRSTGKITYDVCPLDNGNVNPKRLSALIKENTSAVIVTSASNVTGAQPPLDKIKAVLPEKILFIVDGAQGGGHIPLSMKRTGIDAIALAGHKGLCSVQGSGALLFSERANPRPLLFGGTGSESNSLIQPDYYPDALEAGTLSFPAVSALLQGVFYLMRDYSLSSRRILRTSERFYEGLKKLPAYKIYSKPNKCGIISFNHREKQSEEIAYELSEKYSIAVRGGLHCAPLMHKALGTFERGGLVRASFSQYNTDAEIDEFLSALYELQ